MSPLKQTFLSYLVQGTRSQGNHYIIELYFFKNIYYPSFNLIFMTHMITELTYSRTKQKPFQISTKVYY